MLIKHSWLGRYDLLRPVATSPFDLTVVIHGGAFVLSYTMPPFIDYRIKQLDAHPGASLR